MSRTANLHAAFIVVDEGLFPPTASIVETQEGYDVVEDLALFKRGDTLLIWFCGRQQHAYWGGDALITDDGEAIEGAALADVEVLGVATFFINRVREDDSPVM